MDRMAFDNDQIPIKSETTTMKLSRHDVHGKAIDSLVMRFEAQHLTSFSGLIIFQRDELVHYLEVLNKVAA